MKTLIMFFALFGLSSAFAQDTPKKIEIGFGGGVNYSFMSHGPEFVKQIALPGFQFGLGVKSNLSKRFFLIGQVSYVRQSTKYYSDSYFAGAATFETTYSFFWMAMPVQLNYLIGSGKTKNFFFGFGFSPRKLLSSTQDSYTTLSSGAGAVGGSESGRTNDWNLFSTAQTGMRFFLKQGGSVLVFLSYERNIFDLQKPLPTSPYFSYRYDDSSAKMNSFSLGINYFY